MTQKEIVTLLKEPFGWILPGDKMMVVRFDAESKTAGGIIIPDTAQEKPHKGIIIGLGEEITHNEEGLRKASCPYSVGDMIVYGKYAGTELTLDIGSIKGVEVMLMRISDYLLGKKIDLNEG
jgi:chaperonin GroES